MGESKSKPERREDGLRQATLGRFELWVSRRSGRSARECQSGSNQQLWTLVWKFGRRTWKSPGDGCGFGCAKKMPRSSRRKLLSLISYSHRTPLRTSAERQRIAKKCDLGSRHRVQGEFPGHDQGSAKSVCNGQV